MQINEAYDLWAGQYDGMANRTRDIDAAVTRTWLADKHFDKIVEIGCGTGKNTEVYAAHAGTVTALDFSEGMLAQAREKVSARNVTFVQADISKNWPLDGNDADLVCFNLVLEHIEKLDHAFGEAARVLRPGGFLFIAELHPYKQYAGGKANFTYGAEIVYVTAFTHHISDYFGAALKNGLECLELNEHFVDEGGKEVPRLLNMVFRKI